jgi:diacylglycerol kinase family enzyme
MLTTFSTPKVRIISRGGLSWTLDGEDGGVHEVVEIEALHNAYRIVHGNGQAEKNGK